jgi:hypothetical protein
MEPFHPEIRIANLYSVSCLTRELKVSNQLESPVRVSRPADINTMACSCVFDAGRSRCRCSRWNSSSFDLLNWLALLFMPFCTRSSLFVNHSMYRRHPSSTKEQIAHTQTAAKFEVL